MTGKLTEAPEGLDTIAEEEGFEKLPISHFHGERAEDLPFNLSDPFDRMLIAQSQAEGLESITADNATPKYAVRTVNALEQPYVRVRPWTATGHEQTISRKLV